MALTYITLTDSLSCQLPFVRGPEDFSEDLQLTKLPSQLAEPALLVKLEQMKKCEIVDHTAHVTTKTTQLYPWGYQGPENQEE